MVCVNFGSALILMTISDMNNIKIFPAIRLDHCRKEDLFDYFVKAWYLEDLLLKSVIHEHIFYSSPDNLRNPLIFYLGHCAAFYVNKLMLVGLLDKGINQSYEMLFGFGVDPATPGELTKANTNLEWPCVDKIWRYREQVYQSVIDIINNIGIFSDQHLWALLMSMEHQLTHFETSSMLIRQISVENLHCSSTWQYAPYENERFLPNEMVEISGGLVEFGKRRDSPFYGWDNEYGYRQVQVAPFLTNKYPISNREFKIFVDNGGYQCREYWDAAGWQWKNYYQAKHPKFWLVDEYGEYKYRAIFDILPLPLDWPVEVNHFEAMAYCRAQDKKAALMSESQWNLVTYGTNKNDSYDPNRDDLSRYNLNLKFGSPCPVGMLEQNSKICDLRGNLWQWLSDDFNPFAGFDPHFLYLDYSEPFFNGDHKMMLGGSWATAGNQARGYYRNWFRPGFYQHAGFRLSLYL